MAAISVLVVPACTEQSPHSTKLAAREKIASSPSPNDSKSDDKPNQFGETAVPAAKSNQPENGSAANSAASTPGFVHLTPAALAESVSRLERIWLPADTDEAVARLIPEGDAAVEEIERQIDERPSVFGRVHTSVRVLKEVNSEKARKLLNRIAVGDGTAGNPNLEAWAASALIACDRASAWTLLSSNAPQVLTTALNAVDGEPVDKERMELLKKCFQNADLLVQRRAVDVMVAGTSDELALGCVAFIGHALAAVQDLPEINEAAPRQFWGTAHTLGEEYYGRYVSALARARVDDQVLHELAKQQSGRARDVVNLALACRGDQSVHDDIVKLAQDTEAGMFRKWAVDELRIIGTAVDLPILRKLADIDPLERVGPLAPPHPVDSQGPIFPVRIAARSTIWVIENRGR